MSESDLIWKLEQKLCRCCHAEGVFEDLSKPRELNGITEIYSNMLKACFQIVIDSVTGPLSDMTYTICEACILRLRDAYDFMKQVQNAEIKFKDYYNRNAIKGIHEDCDEATETEQNNFTDHEECSLNDDFFMHLDNEDLQNSATEQKEKTKGTKIKKVKNTRDVKKVINKLKKAKKKVDKNETDASEDKDYDVMSLINFTIIRQDDGIVFHNCNICQKNYLTRDAFTKHYRKIHLELRTPPRSCHLCNEKVSKYTKAAHLEKKHDIPAPTCDVCERKFSFPYEVLYHKRLKHMGERRFRCNECGKCYASRLLLKNHLILHSASKDFICQFCDKKFRTEIALRLHIRVHLNVRPHICNICDKKFTQIGSLRHHIKVKHSI